MYRTRYAPSPTGAMHLGHARTALLAWLRARSLGGRIVMRIEDLDPPRVKPGAADAILRDHTWLGLDWDEGPVYQSARTQAYEEALAQLARGGRIYPCTCTRKEIEAALSSAPHVGDPGGELVYPGTCRPDEARRAGPSAQPNRPAALRFVLCAEDAEHERFVDVVQGPVTAPLGGDFVVRRSDGLFAYQLAVVVDDAAQGMERVVRGDDLLSSTPRQMLLQHLLGLPTPSYAHIPLVLAPDGARLAKRHGAVTLPELAEHGLGAPAVLALLAHSLGLASGAEQVTFAELVPGFDVRTVPRQPWIWHDHG